VAALFTHSQALVGEHATLAALQSQAASADVIHLACHAQFRHDNPRFSALHLQDGALTVELAEKLHLRACTVVLSACESGLSEQGGGDEMVGLVRAFLMAGAARVVATLWPVDDAATADFMAHFYGALMRGQAPSKALQQAQACMRQQWPEPYFWAAFTLYGGW
jgi:CHAT domain-containing protein